MGDFKNWREYSAKVQATAKINAEAMSHNITRAEFLKYDAFKTSPAERSALAGNKSSAHGAGADEWNENPFRTVESSVGRVCRLYEEISKMKFYILRHLSEKGCLFHVISLLMFMLMEKE